MDQSYWVFYWSKTIVMGKTTIYKANLDGFSIQPNIQFVTQNLDSLFSHPYGVGDTSKNPKIPSGFFGDAYPNASNPIFPKI